MPRRLLLLVTTCCLATTSAFVIHPSDAHRNLDITTPQPSVNPLRSTVEKPTSTTPKRAEAGDLPPVLQQIADERQEFQLKLGKAMDTIRKDMPDILRKTPDYSIYHKDIKVIDPSGVQLKGLDSYKSGLKFLQTFIRFWFHEPQTGQIQYRMVYDFCRSTIRVSWHVVLTSKLPLGNPLHVDGVSHYKLDSAIGKIVEHKIENLIVNGSPMAPPYGVLSILQQDFAGLTRRPNGIPVGVGVPGMSA